MAIKNRTATKCCFRPTANGEFSRLMPIDLCRYRWWWCYVSPTPSLGFVSSSESPCERYQFNYNIDSSRVPLWLVARRHTMRNLICQISSSNDNLMCFRNGNSCEGGSFYKHYGLHTTTWFATNTYRWHKIIDRKLMMRGKRCAESERAWGASVFLRNRVNAK